MSKKLFIANRSEIACRIHQSAKELDFVTVAPVVAGDEQARHVTYLDEIVTVSSYLAIDALVQAAKDAGCGYVHPGYGFLSERSEFAQKVASAGMQFVGPEPATILEMGEKIRAKKIAQAAKVPTLPWAEIGEKSDLKAVAKELGFPLLLKASAGGGGKGMRIVREANELTEAAEGARAEALAAFGDGTVFAERYVEDPRHLEIQVFGDGRGGGLHLHERECSLQRRHQKIWEEAPAPRLQASTRKALSEAAHRLMSQTKYRSAGTVEFVVDAKENFYFLEMNTRLQVEHPVTEWITGVDLVRWQLQLASDKGFRLPQQAPEPRGHAIEVRICAEDPYQDGRPSHGVIRQLVWPTGPGIRVESGMEVGQEIGTQFDSMLAKLIVHGVDRPHALSRLHWALHETVLLGVRSNLELLHQLSSHPSIVEGKMNTSFLQRNSKELQPTVSDLDLELLSVIRDQGLVVGAATPFTATADVWKSPWLQGRDSL